MAGQPSSSNFICALSINNLNKKHYFPEQCVDGFYEKLLKKNIMSWLHRSCPREGMGGLLAVGC